MQVHQLHAAVLQRDDTIRKLSEQLQTPSRSNEDSSTGGVEYAASETTEALKQQIALLTHELEQVSRVSVIKSM